MPRRMARRFVTVASICVSSLLCACSTRSDDGSAEAVKGDLRPTSEGVHADEFLGSGFQGTWRNFVRRPKLRQDRGVIEISVEPCVLDEPRPSGTPNEPSESGTANTSSTDASTMEEGILPGDAEAQDDAAADQVEPPEAIDDEDLETTMEDEDLAPIVKPCPFPLPRRWKKHLNRRACMHTGTARLYNRYSVATSLNPRYMESIIVWKRQQGTNATHPTAMHHFDRTVKIMRKFRHISYFVKLKGFTSSEVGMIWFEGVNVQLEHLWESDEDNQVIEDLTLDLLCGMVHLHDAGFVFGGVLANEIGLVSPLPPRYATWKFTMYDQACIPQSDDFPCRSLALDFAAPEIWSELSSSGSIQAAQANYSPAADVFSLGWAIMSNIREPTPWVELLQLAADNVADLRGMNDTEEDIKSIAAEAHTLLLGANISDLEAFHQLPAQVQAVLRCMTVADPRDRCSAREAADVWLDSSGFVFRWWMRIMSIDICRP